MDANPVPKIEKSPKNIDYSPVSDGKEKLSHYLFENNLIHSPMNGLTKPIIMDFCTRYRSLSEKNRVKKNIYELADLKDRIIRNQSKKFLIVQAVSFLNMRY